ncbi:MAG: MarR family transcriptional regulator, partial [Hyphomicrobiales bacterium]|nr:MarR family transcriptional regulator [Hyphomicrobiales bacterium]
MADIIYDREKSGARGVDDVREDRLAELDPAIELIELMFFAYRDFTSDPDEILRADGFGRAHHRVLHFVHR